MNATLEGSGALSPMDLSMPRSKGIVIGFWSVTALFCLQIGFTAYAQLTLPQVHGCSDEPCRRSPLERRNEGGESKPTNPGPPEVVTRK